MKKLKLFTCMLLCAGMVFGLTACTTKETETNDVVNSTVESDVVESDTVESDTVESDTVENDTDNDTTASRPNNIFPSMGIDNGFFFATPIMNGEPVHAKMDEVRFTTGGGDGIIVNLAGIGEEYIVSSLNG